MIPDTDPLLRATADGDTACPDGRALAALGQLVRSAATPPRRSDLAGGVLARLNGASGGGRGSTMLSDEAIDAFYDQGDAGAAPGLAALAALVRDAGTPPHPIGLAAGVERALATSARLTPARMDLATRWRVWSAVVAGHVAALLAFAVYQINTTPPGGDPGSEPTISVAANGGAGSVGGRGLPTPVAGPASWAQMPSGGYDLFALRRSPELRDAARTAAGLGASASTVTAALAWLQAQQDPATGRFGHTPGDTAHDVAVQSLALLALLGEGLDAPARSVSVRRGLGWLGERLAGGEIHDDTAAGLASLALVEGALLTGDPGLRAAAERQLARFEGAVPAQPGPSGLGGFVLLALETAEQGGLEVPGRVLEVSRRNLGRALPENDADAGRLGLAALARFISGRGANPSATRLIDALGESHRLPRPDFAARVDPLGWYFAVLAVRQQGGPAWEVWAHELQASLLPCFVQVDGKAWVPAAKVRFADAAPDGDLFATSMALLALQAPYRYLPVK